MKKIVALALSLVMALALCTTAFAAPAYSDAKYFDNYAMGDKAWVDVDLNGAKITYTKAVEKSENGKVVSGSLAYYEVDTDDGYFGPLVEVSSKKDADFQMKIDGVVKYFVEAYDVDYEAVGKEVKAGTKCGDYDKDEYEDATLIMVGDALYVECDCDESIPVLVGNKIVWACEDDDPVVVEHTWASVEGKVVVDYDAEKLAEVKGTVVCKTCGVKATVTNDKGAIPENATVYTFIPGEVWMFVPGNASADAGNGTTSPKTFDAGIAMYVGMSLMSVAGSAVVIGKKKEF